MRASRRSGIVSSESEVTRTASCGTIFLSRTQASTDSLQRLGFCIERKRSVSVKSPCTARVEPDALCEMQIVPHKADASVRYRAFGGEFVEVACAGVLSFSVQ